MEIEKLPVVTQPNMVVSPHPLSAAVDRNLVYNNFLPGESLGTYLDRLDLMPAIQDNFVLSVSGSRVSFDDVYEVFPRTGDLVVMRARLHGGGSNQDSNKALRTVLMVSVLILSQGSAAAWLPIMSGGAVSLGVSSSIILIGGMLLIGALVPVKIPTFEEKEPSPTYALSGGANRARPYEPMPLVFGTVRMYPDFGTRPYTQYINDDQILIQVFNFGLSDVTYADLKIGEADVYTFQGIDGGDVRIIESIGFTGELSDYAANVDSVPGGDMVTEAGNWIQKTSSINTTRLTIDISVLSYFVGVEEGLTYAAIYIDAEYSVAGANTWLPFFNTIVLGIPANAYTRLELINNTKDVLRRSYTRFVTEGTYDVRVRLVDTADVVYYQTRCITRGVGGNCTEYEESVVYSPRGLNEGGMVQVINFDQLKSYQPDDSDYTNQKRMSVVLKANAQLNGSIDRFNAIVSAKVLVWTDPTWTNQASSNPAWQFLSLAKGKFDGSRRIYGAGLSDARIDIDKIKAWAIWCDDKSLECNIVFDAKMALSDMLNTIARCGRATSTWANGVLGVVYDEANLPVTAVFGMSNIIQGTFKVSYITTGQVDEVVIAFNNPAIGWQRDTVKALVTGVINPLNSVTIDIPGITDEAQAGKEANLIAAEQYYRRRIMTWETDIEGLSVQRGEVGALSHDVTKWGYSGRLVSGTTTTLVLDREVPFTPNTQHYVRVKYPDGTNEVRDVNFSGVENLINEPEAFDNVYWTKTETVVIPDNTNAPDGTLTADKIAPTSSPLSADTHVAAGETVAVGINTYSQYFKSGEYTKCRMVLWNSTDGFRGTADFDLDLGVVNSGTGSIEKIGDGWYRCSIFAINTTTLESPYFYVLDDLWSDVFVGNSSDGVYTWGAMLNDGTIADYINDTNIIQLTTPLSSSPDADINNHQMDYIWFFAPLPTPGKLVKITDITPLSEDRVRITATDEEDDFYLAESLTYTYVPPGTFITGIPVISGLSLGEALIIVGSGFGSRVDVSWVVDGEYGGAFIRAGDVATPIRDVGRTLDTRFSFEWPTGKTVTVEVICYNLSFESSDVSKASASLLLIGKAAEPSDVSNFSALQNGPAVILKWSPPADVDLSGTEIRYGLRGASTWEDATPLTEVTKGTNITSQALPDGDWTMYAKHVDTSFNYSINAAESDVLFDTDQDIIVQVEQSPDWVGTRSNFVYHHTGKLVPQSQDADSTDGGTILWAEDTVFENFVNNPFPLCEYTAPELEIGFDDVARLWGDIQSHLGPGETGVANPALEVDYKLDAGAYDGFEPWTIGEVELRYGLFKLTLDTSIGLAAITGFNPTIDQLEHTTIEQFTIGAGGTTVTYTRPFHAVPWGSVTVVSVLSGTVAYATITNITATQALIHVYNTSAVSIGGEAVVTLTGV